jgi:dTDP-4-amino-4,6-dideoxygalactose transaminase
MNFFRPISISISPNTEKDDIWLVLKLIFQPWKWKKGKTVQELEKEFRKYFNVKHAISFNSGRSAFLAILNSLNLEKGDEVLFQVFTCNAVVNPVIYNELKPVYVDVDEQTFNIDIEDLKRKITSKSKVVMIQHTFGLPAEMDEILEICQENNLILIEDCAHSLGADYNGRKIGTFGRAAFFSFSRDKVISSVYGGIVTTNDENLAQKIKKFQEEINYPSYFWILQQLIHPVLLNWLILPTYQFFGKYLLILFQELHILSKAVHWKEKRGEIPKYFPKKMPNALAVLASNQFKKLNKFNRHRKETAEFYYQELKNTSFELPPRYDGQIFLRFTIKHKKAHQIIKQAWKKNILIGDWYDKVIAPYDTNLEKMGYVLGNCPKAEKLAQITLNLPTHINISRKQAQKIVDFLKSSLKV